MSKICRKWTQQAIDCYKRGCKCEGCILSNLESTCQMKISVIELVRKFGVPPEYEGLDKLHLRERQVAEAILNGLETKNEIALYLGVKPSVVQVAIQNLYIVAIEQGYEFIKEVNRLPELVEFIRGAYG